MNTGLRTSTNSGLAGGIVLLIQWLGGYYVPELMAAAPPGADSVLLLGAMWFVARISKTANDESWF